MPSANITTSGGLLSDDFIMGLREEKCPFDGTEAASFALPDSPASKNPDADIALAYDLLRSRYEPLRDRLPQMDLSTLRTKWLLPILRDLGYNPVYLQSSIRIGDERDGLTYTFSHRGWNADTAPVINSLDWQQDFDQRPEKGKRAKSPHDTLQSFLNVCKSSLWGMVTNGAKVRLLRDFHQTLTKGFVEIDLAGILESGDYGDFRAFYRLIHPSRFVPYKDGQCPLELFKDKSQETGVEVGKVLREQVHEAIECLGNAFLRQSPEFVAKLQKDDQASLAYYNEILHLIYRLLFMFFVEQRGWIASSFQVYWDSYAASSLRERSIDPYASRDTHCDLWEGLKVAFRLVRDGYQGIEAGGLQIEKCKLNIAAYGGQLFDEAHVKTILGLSCQNRDLLNAIRLLSSFEKRKVTHRINYARLEIEALGSVYESLLEYTPRVLSNSEKIDDKECQPGEFVLDPRGIARKSSGSYYSGRRLVERLIGSALRPVVEQRMQRARELASKDVANKGRELYAHRILSRPDRLAERDGSRGTVLSVDASVSQGGNIRNDLADKASGNLNSSQHCRGMGQGDHGRVYSLPQNCAGQHEGIGDAIAADRPSGADIAAGYSVAPASVGGSVAHDHRADSLTAPPEGSEGVRNEEQGMRECPSTTPDSLARSFPSWFFSAQAVVGPHSLVPYSLLAEHALLNIKVCDRACGSGAFLIAAMDALGMELARIRIGDESDPTDDQFRQARRDVLQHCIYAVDLNPMAVELCKVTLWIHAAMPKLPLTFLDHRIRCGNSLIGVPTPGMVEMNKRLWAKQKEALRREIEDKRRQYKEIADCQLPIPDLSAETNPDQSEIGNRKSEMKELEKQIRKLTKEADEEVLTWPTHIPDESFEPVTGDDVEAAKAMVKRNREERKGSSQQWLVSYDLSSSATLKTFHDFERLDQITPEEVEQKAEIWRKWHDQAEHSPEHRLADLWTAAFFWKHEPGLRIAPTQGRFEELHRDGTIDERISTKVAELAHEHKFFHWHLEFPEVFSGGRDGFDCVLGNAPWERIKIQEKEWFSVRCPEIANAPNAAARKRMIEGLLQSRPEIHAEFTLALHSAESESKFLRSSGRYPLTGRGDINTYAVFSETDRGLISSTGRVGVIVPTGIATDMTTSHFFQNMVESQCLVSLYDFANTRGLFPSVDRNTKFCLLTVSGKAVKIEHSANFVFFALDPDEIDYPEKRFSLTHQDIALLNPNTGTCPVFRSKQDAELTKEVYRSVPVLVKECDPNGDPWMIGFLPMFHMTNDAHMFRAEEQLRLDGWIERQNTYARGSETFLPLYEAKMLHQYDHRFAHASEPGAGAFIRAVSDYISSEDHRNPNLLSTPRYWVPENMVLSITTSRGLKSDWFLAFRDIGGTVANVRTIVATVLPHCGVGNKAPVLVLNSHPAKLHAAFLSNLNSFMLDYVARQKVGGLTINFFLFKQFAILAPQAYSCICKWLRSAVGDWLLPRVLELIYTAWDLEMFAKDCGYSGPPFKWDEERRFMLRCELDAAYFHLYLGEPDKWKAAETKELVEAFPTPRHAVDYIMETFPIVKRRDVEKHGRYRTKDTILEIYDAMVEAIRTGKPYQTILDPPPADPRVAHPAKEIA